MKIQKNNNEFIIIISKNDDKIIYNQLKNSTEKEIEEMFYKFQLFETIIDNLKILLKVEPTINNNLEIPKNKNLDNIQEEKPKLSINDIENKLSKLF